MKHAAALALVAVFSILPGFGQAPAQTDSQTLQAILAEMRSLHNDVRLGQTTQILLTELEVQQSAVDHALQKRDDAKARVSQLQDNEKNMTAQIARFEDSGNDTDDPQQKKQITQAQQSFKANLGNLKAQEQDRANELDDAETALRKEQDALAGIQDQLNAVVKKLQPASNP